MKLIAFCLGLSTTICAQASTVALGAQVHLHKFENHYLKIQILPAWKVTPTTDQTLNLSKGKYLLSINPVFLHASGIIGGRFSEVVSGKASIDAVMANVDQPASGLECAQTPSRNIVVTESMTLRSLYTDRSKTQAGCIFPASGRAVWFGAFFSGEGIASDYSITLSYSANSVNDLPKKGTSELRNVFVDVSEMLKTLQLKPPLTISRIDPKSTSPGAIVKVDGTGFNLLEQSAEARFSEFPNNPMPEPVVAADGKSLTFEIPASINMISCPAGRIDVNGWCVPIPPDHIDVYGCPSKSGGQDNFCGKPLPSDTYHFAIVVAGVSSESVPLVVTAPTPGPVSIALLYPNYLVSEGDAITVRGTGFTAEGNTVQIGSVRVTDLSSPDGETITLRAPAPDGKSFIQGIRIYSAFVRNAKGGSNPISFEYR